MKIEARFKVNDKEYAQCIVLESVTEEQMIKDIIDWGETFSFSILDALNLTHTDKKSVFPNFNKVDDLNTSTKQNS